MFRQTLLGAALVLFSSGVAYGLSLTNRDTLNQEVLVLETGDEEADNIVLGPGESLGDLCETGCTITLESGEEMNFQGSEVVSIENGHFVLE